MSLPDGELRSEKLMPKGRGKGGDSEPQCCMWQVAIWAHGLY